MERRFTVEVDESGDSPRVALFGEFDMARAEEVEAALIRLEEKRPERLVLDLRGLTFLDSSGLRVVVMAGGRARRDGHALSIVRGPEQVQSVFEITQMDRELPMVDDPVDPPPPLPGEEA